MFQRRAERVEVIEHLIALLKSLAAAIGCNENAIVIAGGVGDDIDITESRVQTLRARIAELEQIVSQRQETAKQRVEELHVLLTELAVEPSASHLTTEKDTLLQVIPSLTPICSTHPCHCKPFVC